MTNIKKPYGFTLIELSIVLVIISLVVGGIIGGKALIHSANVRSTISDLERFDTAINNFRLQFDALPGDLRDAYDYFQNDSTCTNNNINTTSGGCNGDGDGRISVDHEGTIFWHHLSVSQMIPESFVAGAWTEGTSPRLSLNNATIRVYYFDGGGGGGSYGSFGGNRMRIATLPPAWVSGPAFTPRDIKSIDKKMDDGKPANGNFIGRNAQLPDNSYYTDCLASGDYNVAVTEVHCYAFYYPSGLN